MMRTTSFGLFMLFVLAAHAHSQGANVTTRPNIVVVVADDMGWRDTGYSGNPIAKTPALDEMASRGVRFDYFYAAQQMCSPGRFAILTGRSPFRTGLHALGAMRPQEITVAQALKTVGYSTGHFGKWHLGSKTTSPVKMGFDEAIWKINYYDVGASLQVGDSKELVPLEGDSSVATMALALDFIRKTANDREPFFVQVCFGSPHSPHVATNEFKALYPDLSEKQQNFWGEISGVDAAVGNLRRELKKLGISDNTLVWFTSDNGGITRDSQDPAGKGKGKIGVRTVAVLEWPTRVKEPICTSVPCIHQDIYPTLLDITGVTMPDQPVLDGVSLAPLLEGKMEKRNKPIGFLLRSGRGGSPEDTGFAMATQAIWIDGPLKLVVSPTGGDDESVSVALYDIFADPAEKTNLAPQRIEDVQRMRAALNEWRTSVQASYDGKDFSQKE